MAVSGKRCRMCRRALESQLALKKIDAEKIVELILAEHDLVDHVIQGLSDKLARVRFGCAKSLMVLSQRRPDVLYAKIGRILDLLESENQILKWNAIIMLGNLAAVDHEHLIRGVLPKLYGFLSGGKLITANNTMAALGKIGRAFPEEQGRITSQLLKIEHAQFPTDECKNIAIGESILAMGMFIEPAKARKEVLEYVQGQTGNRRNSTAEKAKLFLQKVQKTQPV